MQHQENPSITKQFFVSIIERMSAQYFEDMANALKLNEIFRSEDCATYDNGKLYKSLIELLNQWFPEDNDGFNAIYHYCFDLEFGKHYKDGPLSASDFYDQLIFDSNNETKGQYSK